MNTQTLIKHFLLGIAAIGGFFLLISLSGSPKIVPHTEPQHAAAPPKEEAKPPLLLATEKDTSPLAQEARQMQEDLFGRMGASPSFTSLKNALRQRDVLLSRSVEVQWNIEDKTETEPWNILLQENPSWVVFEFSFGIPRFKIDTDIVRNILEQERPFGLEPPRHSVLIATATGDVLRAETSDIAQGGYVLDYEEAAKQIATALQENKSTTAVPLQFQEGRIFYATEGKMHTLELLASGKSNFAGSPRGRKINVHKALVEHINNVLVPPNEVFSFNSTLGGPVTLQNGWAESLGIFNGGKELRLVAGGGICQVSTTLYRAIANAGLPIDERRSHSLYVHYYEKYGVGMDATIYPGVQDLVFTNDTPSYLLVQAFAEGDDAIVKIYGVPDGRDVTIEGPYTTANAPEELRVNGRRISKNEIAWVQHIRSARGATEEHIFVSRYREPISAEVLGKIRRGEDLVVSL